MTIELPLPARASLNTNYMGKKVASMLASYFMATILDAAVTNILTSEYILNIYLVTAPLCTYRIDVVFWLHDG